MTTTKPIPRWLYAALTIAPAVMLLALGGLLLLNRDRSNLPVYGEMPAFELKDQKGQPVKAADLKGKVLLVGFIYTSCTDICPTVTVQMRGLQEKLQRTDLLVRDAVMLSISVDPERDTPDVLAEYARTYGADTATWRFLTGEVEHVRQVVVNGFLVGMDKTPASGHAGHTTGTTQADYNVEHSGRIALVDKQGQIRGYYDGTSFDWEQVIKDVLALR